MISIDESVFQAEGCRIVGDVTIGRDSSVWYNAVIRGDDAEVVIGEKTNIQDLCMVHVCAGMPTVIGNGVTVGHSAIIHGCRIGDNTLIGMGSIIMNGAVIGKNCVIGAGALVTGGTVIPDNSLAFGSPAKVVRTIDAEGEEANRKSAEFYLQAARESVSEQKNKKG